ncbi:MAG: hypothetical protein AB7K24_04145 [Gemmataceae bacterium]
MKQAWELFHDARIQLSPEGQQLLRADLAVETCFELLLEQGCYADARRLLAQALPRRRGLWWGLVCARDYYQAACPPRVTDVLDIVDDHVKTRSEESRRRAEEVGMGHAPDDLTGCLALAVFFSGDSISAPDLPTIAPKPYVAGRFVEVAVYLAAVLKDPLCYKDHLRRYLQLGCEMLHANDPWLNVERPDVPTSTANTLICTGGVV